MATEAFFSKNLSKVDWWCLSGNSNIPVEFFEKHLDNVDWHGLSRNTNIPSEFFERHLDRVDWDGLSRNTNIPVEFFESHLDKVDWNRLSKNKFSIITKKNAINKIEDWWYPKRFNTKRNWAAYTIQSFMYQKLFYRHELAAVIKL